jgi:hypothetical protein
LIDRLADSAKRVQKPLAPQALFEEVANGLPDQVIATLIGPLASSCSTCFLESAVSSRSSFDLTVPGKAEYSVMNCAVKFNYRRGSNAGAKEMA